MDFSSLINKINISKSNNDLFFSKTTVEAEVFGARKNRSGQPLLFHMIVFSVSPAYFLTGWDFGSLYIGLVI